MTQHSLYLLPGFHGSANLFAPLISHLGTHIEAHPLRFESAASIEEHAAIISPSLPANNVLLVAESFSGLIALALLQQNPDRFKGVVLCAAFARTPMIGLARIGACLPTFAYRKTPLKRLVLNHFCLNNTSNMRLKKEVLAAITAVEPITIKKRISVLSATDLRGKLANITTPVLCLAAAHDRVVPRQLVDALVHELPNARIEELAGPHLLLQACPGAAAAAIETFINQL